MKKEFKGVTLNGIRAKRYFRYVKTECDVHNYFDFYVLALTYEMHVHNWFMRTFFRRPKVYSIYEAEIINIDPISKLSAGYLVVTIDQYESVIDVTEEYKDEGDEDC